MKTLFIGGVKSGKSRLAEQYVLKHYAKASKPCYLATNEFFDAEMQERVRVHQQRRQEYFITLEEPIKLLDTLSLCETPVLVECVTIWLSNMLHYQNTEADILQELEDILLLPNDIVFVHNEVGFGVIPENPLARQFVDLSGKAAQLMGQYCDKVFFCSAGLALSMK